MTSYEAEITFPDFPGQSIMISSRHGKWRQDWTVKSEGNSTSASATGFIFEVDDTCPAKTAFPVPATGLWLPRDPVQDWMDLGVNNATKSFGFRENTPALIIGAEPGDETSPQVWLDNETYAPLKLIFNAHAGRVQFVFESYVTFAGFEVPKSGKVIFGDNEPIEFNIGWISIRKKLDPSIFRSGAVESDGCALPSSEPFDIFSKYLAPKN